MFCIRDMSFLSLVISDIIIIITQEMKSVTINVFRTETFGLIGLDVNYDNYIYV